MKVDLTQIPVLVSTCSDPIYTSRAEKVTRMLDKIGFSNYTVIAGRKQKPYQRGANENIKRILSFPSVPFILFEDDIALNKDNYCPVIEIPDETDVLYLGGCLHANKDIHADYVGGTYYNNAFGFADSQVVYSYIDEDCKPATGILRSGKQPLKEYVRIYNMYSGHAILFLTDLGRRVFLNATVTRSNMPFDVAFSYSMYLVNTLLYTSVMFYQDDNHNNQFTKKVIYYPDEPFYNPAKELKEHGKQLARE